MSIITPGNRKYLGCFGPYWYFVEDEETDKRWSVQEDELEPLNEEAP